MYSGNSTLCSSWAICMGVPTLIHFLFPLLELIFILSFPLEIYFDHDLGIHGTSCDHFENWLFDSYSSWSIILINELRKYKKKKRDCMWLKAISSFEVHIFRADGLLQNSLVLFLWICLVLIDDLQPASYINQYVFKGTHREGKSKGRKALQDQQSHI